MIDDWSRIGGGLVATPRHMSVGPNQNQRALIELGDSGIVDVDRRQWHAMFREGPLHDRSFRGRRAEPQQRESVAEQVDGRLSVRQPSVRSAAPGKCGRLILVART